MKANEAPDKIYAHVRANKELGTTWHGTWIGVNDIEYSRTDAFIAKATSYIQQHWIWNTEMIEDFKNYMKGE